MATKKNKSIKRRRLSSTVAIEISASELALVVVDRQPDGSCQVSGYRAQWLYESPGLSHEAGAAELTAALAPIVEQANLVGGDVHVALSSDYCVTRVVAGETNSMLAELRNLRERSAHYLSLGAGSKAVSQSIRALDARNSQAWLTVTDRNTLANVTRALEDAGLFPAMIEHSMVAVCRAVGRMDGDSTAPAIIIEPSGRGVDLGISYRGQLLFDYRPGGVGSKESIVDVVEHHLERIQRYCSRFFRFAGGQLNRVYLVGNPTDVDEVRVQFGRSQRLTAEVINPTTTCADWTFSDTLVENPSFVAALGSALVSAEQLRLAPNDRGFPDLMDAVRNQLRPPVWPLARQHLWPVAAASLLGMAVYGGALVEHARAGAIERQVSEVQTETDVARTMQLEREQLQQRKQYLERLDRDLAALPVDALLAGIVKVKPAAIYLDDIKVSQDGLITLTGKSEQREAVFEFESNLKQATFLRSPRIESTRRDRLPTTDNATWFTLKAKFVDYADHSAGRSQ